MLPKHRNAFNTKQYQKFCIKVCITLSFSYAKNICFNLTNVEWLLSENLLFALLWPRRLNPRLAAVSRCCCCCRCVFNVADFKWHSGAAKWPSKNHATLKWFMLNNFQWKWSKSQAARCLQHLWLVQVSFACREAREGGQVTVVVAWVGVWVEAGEAPHIARVWGVEMQTPCARTSLEFHA